MYLPIYMSPSSLILAPGRYVYGHLLLEEVGNEKRLNWRTFQPSMEIEGLEFQYVTEGENVFGKVSNYTSEGVILTPKFLFGYLLADPFANWRFSLQRTEIGIGTIDDDDLSKTVKVLKFDEAEKYYQSVNQMKVGEVREVEKSLQGNDNLVILHLVRFS